MKGPHAHGDYLWLTADELPNLIAQLVEHHPRAHLLVTSFDSGPLILGKEELTSGWTQIGSLVISPPLTKKIQIPSAGFDEWYVFDEPPGPSFDPEVFVNYVPFPLGSRAAATEEVDPWHAEASQRFWRQLTIFRPLSYVARADSDLVVSRCEPFVRSLATPPRHNVRELFSAAHLAVMQDPDDRVHDACDFLILDSPYPLLQVDHVNDSLHGPARVDPWPPFLVAFASNGCGDYYAYDFRTEPPVIRYVDPDKSIEENLRLSRDNVRFASFSDWYAHKVKGR